MMKRKSWREIPASEIPQRIVFRIAPQDQGQIVEYAYGGYGADVDPRNDPFMRVMDRSDPHPRYKYYRRDQ